MEHAGGPAFSVTGYAAVSTAQSQAKLKNEKPWKRPIIGWRLAQRTNPEKQKAFGQSIGSLYGCPVEPAISRRPCCSNPTSSGTKKRPHFRAGVFWWELVDSNHILQRFHVVFWLVRLKFVRSIVLLFSPREMDFSGQTPKWAQKWAQLSWIVTHF